MDQCQRNGLNYMTCMDRCPRAEKSDIGPCTNFQRSLPLLGIDPCRTYSCAHYVDIGPCTNFQRSLPLLGIDPCRTYSCVHHVDIGPCTNFQRSFPLLGIDPCRSCSCVHYVDIGPCTNFQRSSRQSKRICNHPSIGLPGSVYGCDYSGKGGNCQNHHYQKKKKKSPYPTHFVPLLGIVKCTAYSRFHHVDIGPCMHIEMIFQRSSLCP